MRMKKLKVVKMIKLLMIAVLSIGSITFGQQTDLLQTGNLTILVTGIENNEGKIRIALSDSEENYNSRDTVFAAAVVPIKNNKALFIFKNIPLGEYAVKLFHDENENGELDTNFLGIPSEDYGFSNNASGTFGPADYEDAKFIFNQPELTLAIDID